MGSVKIKKIEVQCKCPICHTIHTEQWGCRPDVTPWRYCKQECGMTKRSAGAQRSAGGKIEE